MLSGQFATFSLLFYHHFLIYIIELLVPVLYKAKKKIVKVFLKILTKIKPYFMSN